jgi:hypothetical protein
VTALAAKAPICPARPKKDFTLPVKADAIIYPGAKVAMKDGLLQPVAAALELKHFCTATNTTTVDNTGGNDGDLTCNVEFDDPKTLVFCKNDGASPIVAGSPSFHIGQDAYAVDDSGVVSADGTNRTRLGTPWLVVSSSDALGQRPGVYVELDLVPDAADLESELAATTNGNGASMVGIEDAGAFTTAANVEAALAELYQDAKSTQGHIDLMPNNFCLADGNPLEAFADGASPIPGRDPTDAKTIGIRWNNHATPDPVTGSFMVPPDADITANMTLTVRASKVGATLADATRFTIGAFNQVVGALHDADADFGGDTTAMTGDAATKTIQAVTLTLALANLAASPASVTLTVQPKDGTLGTDDVVIHSIRIAYKKKLLTS